MNVKAKEVNFGDYYALLIGNQNYSNNYDWKDLSTPHSDVDALAKLLKNTFGFNVLVKKDLNRGEIIDLIENYKKKLSHRDNLLIYYAGHGHLREDGGYWIGINGKKESRSDWLGYGTISLLIDSESGMKAKHVLVIADSCYAGAAYRGNDSELKRASDESDAQWIERMVKNRTRRLFSSGGEQPVLDRIGNTNHSVFANELLDTLIQIAKRGKITLTQDIYRNIAPDVHQRTKRILKNAQAPEYKKIPGTGDQGGDFIFKPLSSKLILIEEDKYKNRPKSPMATRSQSKNESKTATIDYNDDKNDWNRLEPMGSEGWKMYLKWHPNGAWTKEARSRLNEKNIASKKSLTVEEQAQIDSEWQTDIQYSSNSKTVEQFLKRNPVGSHVPTVEQKLEELRMRGQ